MDDNKADEAIDALARGLGELIREVGALRDATRAIADCLLSPVDLTEDADESLKADNDYDSMIDARGE